MLCMVPIIGPTLSLIILTGWIWIQLVCGLTGNPIFAGASTIISILACAVAF